MLISKIIIEQNTKSSHRENAQIPKNMYISIYKSWFEKN